MSFTKIRNTTMDNKLKNKMITAMVFWAEDTSGMVINLNGFDNPNHADDLGKTLMKNSGMDEKSSLDMNDIPNYAYAQQ